ncbi:major facilitator superfamily MFS_1 [Thermocrinis albus DSM 14484]|uniref:Major facilitator superfamily MFS_1 n=1 Tax=Thermocrinis albus (strain DSM 14484 / JCM 11386 / HI 11/12) TaxID=638303 RepID=D3SP42_THEAH|nr:MFS transporter [Thermocrinis albus]ADC88929.1 major facilitator superfamily MFS_1 [Thermocrinis albus DSM 14484]
MLKEFTPEERKAVLGITFAVAVRMLGLFLLLPVLSPYLRNLEGASPQLIGLAVGIYGFAQAFLQIPFGYLSDRIGRKPVIFVGMLTYAIGSLMGGLASNIWTMVLARFIQGFGAVSSAMTALAADLTREEVRTRAFAHIGASIGLVFAFSITAAPVLAGYLGVPFLFYMTALLSLVATFYVMFFIPEPKVHASDREIKPSLSNILLLLKDPNQLVLNFSIALTHAFLTGIFTFVPYQLVYNYHFPKPEHFKIYLPAVLVSLAIMVPSTIFAEKRGKFKEVFLAGILSILVGFALYDLFRNFWGAVALVFLFFVGFHLLEPIVPSLLTKLTHRDVRGLALGFFNTTQFLGAFLGGVWGGFALKHGLAYLVVGGAVLCVLWLLVVYVWFSSVKIPKRAEAQEPQP